MPGPPPLTVARLAGVLVGVRYRSWRGSLRAGPRVAAARLGLVFALVVPTAYVGLFASALAEIGAVAGSPGQELVLALVAGLVVLASFASKLAAGDLVVGRGGEVELLLARPLSLATLVAARGLAGVLTDLFGALFLLPILIAAALTWQLPPLAVAVAALSSIATQVTLAAAAQAGQIAIVHLVPPRRRRLVFVIAALAAAASMAAIWLAGSTVLRAPSSAAAAMAPLRAWALAGPGGLVTAPVRWLAAGHTLASLGALLLLLAGAALALAVAALVARWASRAGWEQADAGWAEAGAPARSARFPEVGLAGKDWRLLARDRARLVTLLALPLLFVGVQIFGSAGWAWSTGSVTRLGVCAYSLAAYAATFGPLVHLEAERRAFWILRAVPVPLARLFGAKAAFWAAVLAGFALATYLTLALAADLPFAGEGLVLAFLCPLGAALVAFLAVGLGASEADLSDDQRPALGLGTAYLFMIVAGLFNLVLLARGPERWTALGLYLLCTAIAFVVGVERARVAFDPDEMRRRHLSPVVGTIGLVVLYLGHRSAVLMQPVAGDEAAAVGAGVWLAMVGLLAVVHHARPVPRPARADRVAAIVALLLALASIPAVLLRPSTPALYLAILIVAVAGAALVQELLARGLVQQGLAPAGTPRVRRWLAFTLAAALVLLGSAGRPPLLAVGAAILPGLAALAFRRAPLLAACIVRLLLELLPALL
jgi:hypothetical protein